MLLFFYSFFIHAQDIAEKVINGTIICDSSSVEGVHVLNLVTKDINSLLSVCYE